MKKVKLYVIFNANGQYVALSLEPLRGNIKIKELEVDAGFNLAMYDWVGDFDSGSLQLKSDIPHMVSSLNIEEKFYDKLFRKYPIERMLTIMLAQLRVIVRQEYIAEKHVNGKCADMLDFFDKIYKKMLNDIDHYKNSEHHTYMDEDEILEDMKKRFEI